MSTPATLQAIIISLAAGIGLLLMGGALALKTANGGTLDVIGWGLIALGIFALFTAIAFAVGAYDKES
jgi:hypothetical protein